MSYKKHSFRFLFQCFLFFTLILSQTARAQYCVFSLGGGYCFTNDILSGVEIAGTTLVNYNNGCALTTGSDSYSNFPASGSTTATVTWGQTYTLKVVSTSNSIISFWIDYNHNYVFDASEWKQIANGCAPGLVLTVNFTVPYGIYIGKTKMRIRSRAYGNPNNSSSACTHFATGETEDYTLTITGPLCTLPPNAGQVLPTLSALCQGTVDTFKLKSNDHGYGLTYQWQVSPASLNWSNIAGAVDTVLVQTVLAASYYRCIVTCSGVSDTTAPVFVWVKPNNLCYCLSNATSSIRTDIGYVRFSNLQNGTDTSKYNNPTANKTYSDYTYLPPADVMVSASYTMRVNQISGSSNYSVSDIYAYIDFNHDTVYNTTTERFHIGSTFAPGGETVSGFITIPATALTGITGMRIILKEGSPSPQNPCGTYNNGETEDYLINIQGPSPCISPPIGGITNATESYACAGSVVSFYLQGNSIGIGQTFQWQFSSDGINWISKPGATLASYSDSIFSSMYYRCLLICNSDSAYSSSKHIALNPITQCNYCTSTAQFNTDSDIGYFSIGSLINATDTTARNNPTSTKLYSDFTTLPAPNLPRNSSHIIDLIQINKTFFFIACYAKAYIDYNQDGFFNNSDEMIDIGQTNSGPGGNRLTKAITIPATALLGNTRMRIVLRQYGSISPTPCGTYNYGETEDYTVNIVPNIPPCTSPPTGGSILASDSIVCPGTLVFFTLQGNSTGSGQIYQWQSSSNNINWASILGANSESYSDTINVGANYRCSILCNGQLTYSTVQSISMDTINPCYCQSNANYVLYNDIGYVSISTLQNGTDTSTFNNSTANNSYTDFTNLPATNLIQGQNYTIRIIQINNSITLFQSYATLYIDFNEDGNFNSIDETFPIGLTTIANQGKLFSNIFIPYTSALGPKRMRIKLTGSGSALQSPCGSYFFGETEDYTVNIVSGTPCVAPPTGGLTVALDSTLCSGALTSLYLQGNSVGFGQSYQWENSTNNTTWSIIQGANYPYYNVNFSGPMYYRCQVSCNAQTVSSTSVKILATDTALCYCSANLGGALCGSSWSRSNLINVTISGTSLNNSNPICAITNGSSINAFPPYGNSTATLLTGNTYTLSVTTSYNNSLAVWIDYNQNGIFESSEWKQITNSSTASAPSSTNLTIPQGIPTGKTGMRIRSIENISGTLTANSACSNYITGETEDYIITIDLGNSIRKTPDEVVINISPNPASEELKISSTTILSGKSHLELTNASGQLIYMEELVNFSSKTIDVSQFPKGIYFLKLTSTASLIIKKVILE